MQFQQGVPPEHHKPKKIMYLFNFLTFLLNFTSNKSRTCLLNSDFTDWLITLFPLSNTWMGSICRVCNDDFVDTSKFCAFKKAKGASG